MDQFIAKCEFDAGKSLQFKKGETVTCDEATAEFLLSKGLIEKAPVSGELVEPASIPSNEVEKQAEAQKEAPAPVPVASPAPKKKHKKE